MRAGLKRLKALLYTSAVRLALTSAVVFSLSTTLLFAFVYWRTAIVEVRRIDVGLVRDLGVMADEQPAELLASVRARLASDLHRVTYAAVLDPAGRKIVGNLTRMPPGLEPNGTVRRTEILVPGAASGREIVLLVGRRLADGDVLVLGRSIDSLANLHAVMIRALELGILPAIMLSLLAGAVMSRHVRSQIRAVHLATERIIQGDLHNRLSLRGNGDDFDRLAGSVNRMLDEIERLLNQAQSTADNIAHDLRTPLTRVRARLERGLQAAQSREELQEAVERAIVGLDQALRIITALLRIGHVERGHRRANFVDVDLKAVVEEIADLFEPIAEEKGIALRVAAPRTAVVHGDRDLLGEAVANLVDNAVKFTPAGGRVTVSLAAGAGLPAAITVSDTGPGIRPEERAAVLRRFYRSDTSGHVEGLGLGLSLVEAILALHGFHLAQRDAAHGSVFEIVCG